MTRPCEILGEVPPLARRVAAALFLVGLVTVAHPARASRASVLEGTWAVAQATLNGELRMDGKVINSTWTFRGDELVPASPAFATSGPAPRRSSANLRFSP